ncbi:unnamed protein product, partial [Adineta steineri]
EDDQTMSVGSPVASKESFFDKYDDIPIFDYKKKIQPQLEKTSDDSDKLINHKGRLTGEVYTSRGTANGRPIYQGVKGGLYYLTSTDGWKPIGHTLDEQNLLHNMSIIVAGWFENTNDTIPTVPCLSADGHLLVLSVAASHIRYGVSLTFMTVYPDDMKATLPKRILSHPLSSNKQRLWCIFSDGSVTPVYT